MLSSAHVAIISLSLWFQAISEILAVWPPCTKRSSGGPSFFSSSVYGRSIRERSHIITLRSLPDDAKRLENVGENLIYVTSSLWCLKENSLHLTFLVSQTAIERSADPVMSRFGSKGEASTHIISAMWASILLVGCLYLKSHMLSLLSSLTVANRFSLWWFQQTSSTTWVWASNVCKGSRVFES